MNSSFWLHVYWLVDNHSLTLCWLFIQFCTTLRFPHSSVVLGVKKQMHQGTSFAPRLISCQVNDLSSHFLSSSWGRLPLISLSSLSLSLSCTIPILFSHSRFHHISLSLSLWFLPLFSRMLIHLNETANLCGWFNPLHSLTMNWHVIQSPSEDSMILLCEWLYIPICLMLAVSMSLAIHLSRWLE